MEFFSVQRKICCGAFCHRKFIPTCSYLNDHFARMLTMACVIPSWSEWVYVCFFRNAQHRMQWSLHSKFTFSLPLFMQDSFRFVLLHPVECMYTAIKQQQQQQQQQRWPWYLCVFMHCSRLVMRRKKKI